MILGFNGLGFFWTVEIGRTGSESAAEASEDASGVSHTGSAFERADGPYSADFLTEEPDYEWVIPPGDPQCRGFGFG